MFERTNDDVTLCPTTSKNFFFLRKKIFLLDLGRLLSFGDRRSPIADMKKKEKFSFTIESAIGVSPTFSTILLKSSFGFRNSDNPKNRRIGGKIFRFLTFNFVRNIYLITFFIYIF